MHAWEAIELALNYIESHLAENLSTEALAETVGLSPFYFQRLFKRLVCKPVQEYIKLRKLAHSIDSLKNTDNRILDIALDSGFSSHANYTRAFKEVFGLSPETYRRERPTLNTFIKPEISMNYTLVDENVPLIAGNIILEIQKRALKAPDIYLGYESKVSMANQIPAGEKTGIDVPGELWKKFHNSKMAMLDLYSNGIELGVSHSPNRETNSFLYFVGGSISKYENVALADMTTFCLQPGEYVVCRIEADSFEFLVTNALYQANKYLYDIWLPKHNITSQHFAAEKYFKAIKDIHYMELWIPT